MLQSLLRIRRAITARVRARWERFEDTQTARRWRIGIGVALGLAVVALSVFLFPRPDLFVPPDFPREGDIATADIIAPFDFPVLKSQEELDDERRRILTETPPVLSYDQSVADSVQRTTTLFFDYAERMAESKISLKLKAERLAEQFPWLDLSGLSTPRTGGGWLALRFTVEDVIRRMYASGIFPDNRYLPASQSQFVMVTREARGDLPLQREQILDLKGARTRLANELAEIPGVDSLERATLLAVVGEIVTPNLRYNHETTEARRQAALADVRPYKVRIFRGERIVAKHERVTAAHAERLRALALSRAAQIEEERAIIRWLPYAARIVFAAFCVVAVVVHFRYFRPRYLKRLGPPFALAVIWTAILLATRFASAADGPALYLIPIPFAAILVTILFDLGTGLVSTVFLSLLVGIVTGYDYTVFLVGFSAGMITAYTVRTVRRRYDFYRPALYGACVYIVVIALVEALRYTPGEQLLNAVGFGLVNAVSGAVVAVGVLPVFESLFGFTTDLTLLELSNLNHPLLRRLSLEAPGTYHHSIVIGSLAESAAEAIGANPLLARVGAYFHDIGKMEKPEYFAENHPHYKSRHEKLTPSMSALVLESHVKQGKELALEYDLPDAVIDFIEQHHGTTTMAYFFHKAKAHDHDASEEEFRYPGPKPQSRETAILMLADSVEAVSRTLDDPKPARLRAAIKKVIEDKFLAGQLEECNLTLRDLHLIEESFLKILGGVFHQRVKYPAQLGLDVAEPESDAGPDEEQGLRDTPAPSTIPVEPERTGNVRRSPV